MEQFTLRLYDMYWIDIFTGSYDDVKACYNKKTSNGKYYTKYSDGSYFDIFPANTKMLYNEPLY